VIGGKGEAESTVMTDSLVYGRTHGEGRCEAESEAESWSCQSLSRKRIGASCEIGRGTVANRTVSALKIPQSD